MSWKGVITNAGSNLLNQLAAGTHYMSLLGATVGSGYVADSAMVSATALSSEKDTAKIVSVDETAQGVQIRVQIEAINGTGYTAHEIGIWACQDSDTSNPVLFALHQDSSGGIGIPSKTDTPDFAAGMYLLHAMSSLDGIVITIDSNALASFTDLAALKAEIDDEIEAVADDVEDVQDTIAEFMPKQKKYNKIVTLSAAPSTLGGVQLPYSITVDFTMDHNGTTLLATLLTRDNAPYMIGDIKYLNDSSITVVLKNFSSNSITANITLVVLYCNPQTS